jgi:hypothetical protein
LEKPITGGCLCGKVRYTFSAHPIFSGNCHCRDCQKSSGSAYTPALFVPENAVNVSGQVQYFTINADSGRTVSRGFCPNCGSQLFSQLELLPDMLGIRAGSLDNPDEYKPSMDIFTASAACWDVMNPDLSKYSHAPD